MSSEPSEIPVPAIKCRARLERLRPLGLEVSRGTGWTATMGEPDAFLISADGRAWLVKFWLGTTRQPALFDEPGKASGFDEALAALYPEVELVLPASG